MEDLYGLTIECKDGDAVLHIDSRKGNDAAEISKAVAAWAEQAEKYRSGEIDREAYDRWRYNYPAYDENSSYVKVPSQELSDALVKAFKGKLKDI